MMESERGKRKGMVHDVVRKGIAKATEYELCSVTVVIFASVSVSLELSWKRLQPSPSALKHYESSAFLQAL